MPGGFLESVVLIELLGTVIESVDKPSPDTDLVRNRHGPVDGVLQQRGTELDALRSPINRQTRENHHRNRVRHVAPHATGGLLVRHSTCSHRVVSVDPRILTRRALASVDGAEATIACCFLPPRSAGRR